MRTVLVLALSALSSTAMAVPMHLDHQGRLFDGAGAPLTSNHDVVFALYDTSAAQNALWTETLTLTFDNGYFQTRLGDGTALNSDDFATDEMWLGIAVGGNPELSRITISSVPFALAAGSVAGGPVDATSVQINGTTIIDSDGHIDFASVINTPVDRFAGLNCTANQVLGYDGSDWVCQTLAAVPTTFAASAVTSGTFNIDRLPVGNGADFVAAGDHSHTLVGNAPGDCGSSEAGEVAFDPVTSTLSYCDGGSWRALNMGSGQGTTASPGRSCKTILANGHSIGSGKYIVDPNGGDAADAFEVWCDMDTDGGGWTLVTYAGIITTSKTVTAGSPDYLPLFHDWGTYDSSATSTNSAFSRLDLFEDILTDQGSFMAYRTSVPEKAMIWPVSSVSDWRVARRLPSINWLRLTNDGIIWYTRGDNLTVFNQRAMPYYSGYNWNRSATENCDGCGSFDAGMNHRSLLYWEVQDASGYSQTQWFHGTPLALGSSGAPQNTVQDIGIYYRE